MEEAEFYNSKVVKELSDFKYESEIVIANRLTEDLADIKNKVYTRDLYNDN